METFLFTNLKKIMNTESYIKISANNNLNKLKYVKPYKPLESSTKYSLSNFKYILNENANTNVNYKTLYNTDYKFKLAVNFFFHDLNTFEIISQYNGK